MAYAVALAGIGLLLSAPLPRRAPLRLGPAARSYGATMGVAGFCKWIEAEAPEAVIAVPDNFTQSVVAFDMNALLHSQLRRADDADHAITLVFARMHDVLRHVKPGSTVLLALDGPAPVAKLATQRTRRLKTLRKEASESEPSRGVTTLVATPGTAFMRRLEDALVFFVCGELGTQRARGLSFFLSGADVPGEGEIKLLGALHQLERQAHQWPPPQLGGGGVQQQGPRRTVTLVGADGDLVLQALTLRRWDVSVLREVPARGKRASIVSLDRLRDALGLCAWPDAPTGASRRAAPRRARATTTTTRAPPPHRATPPHRTAASGRPLISSLDLVALTCLMGNDYVPKTRGANFERVWSAFNLLLNHPRFRADCARTWAPSHQAPNLRASPHPAREPPPCARAPNLRASPHPAREPPPCARARIAPSHRAHGRSGGRSQP